MAKRILNLLESHTKSSASKLVIENPQWHKEFWNDVAARGRKPDELSTLLLSHGNYGPGSSRPPRPVALKRELEELVAAGGAEVSEEAVGNFEEDSGEGLDLLSLTGCHLVLGGQLQRSTRT